jgi:hypothetical protein
MFNTKSGEQIFVIDAHVHLWDGSAKNQKNIHGKQFIECFYDYHKLRPKDFIWPFESISGIPSGAICREFLEARNDQLNAAQSPRPA